MKESTNTPTISWGQLLSCYGCNVALLMAALVIIGYLTKMGAPKRLDQINRLHVFVGAVVILQVVLGLGVYYFKIRSEDAVHNSLQNAYKNNESKQRFNDIIDQLNQYNKKTTKHLKQRKQQKNKQKT